MDSYETSATVESQGRVLVAGVPFAAGTKVDVIISPIVNGDGEDGSLAVDRYARLLNALDKAGNRESVGPLRRDELYDRDILH
jgi:hypothetical protein